jgi:hypothetical protein
MGLFEIRERHKTALTNETRHNGINSAASNWRDADHFTQKSEASKSERPL